MNRAWTYIISRQLNLQELEELQSSGNNFISSWTAHESQLNGSFQIFEKRIIIVKVNEDVNAASGCSIDKLTRFIKQSETRFNVQLLNRMLVAMQTPNGIEVLNALQVKELLSQNKISADSIIYNTSLANQSELAAWEQPLKNTWLNKYLLSA